MNACVLPVVASEKGVRRVEGPGGDVPRPRLSRRVMETLMRRAMRRQAEYDEAWAIYRESHELEDLEESGRKLKRFNRAKNRVAAALEGRALP